jgi:STE24 endopeptidase
MQIKYVKNAKNLQPIILLDSSKYKEAANYSIGKDKLEMYLSGYNFILSILWIVFGLSCLDSMIQIESYCLKAIIFVNTFILINLILTLPFKLFLTFNLDKKYSFLHITPTEFIKDTMDSVLLFLVLSRLQIPPS